MDIIIQILAFVITVLVLVSIHEAGHFGVAKLLGVKVLRFSVGFGKPLLRFLSKSGTEYVIAWLPLGGYVKLLDEREMTVPAAEKHLAFNLQPLWKRIAIVLAGPLTNFLFAIFAFWIMFLVGIESIKPVVGKVIPNSAAARAGLQAGDEILSVDGRATHNWQQVLMAMLRRTGEQTAMNMQTENLATHHKKNITLDLKNWHINTLNPDPLPSLGVEPFRPYIPPIVDDVLKQSPAEKAGLKTGDKIISVDNKPVKDWIEFVLLVQKQPDKKMTITYQRGNKTYETMLQVASKRIGNQKTGYIGVTPPAIKLPPHLKRLRHYNPITALIPATQETWELFVFNFIVLKKMVMGEISLNSLGGPIAIFRIADLALRQGIVIFVGFLAFISVMLAFINVLPIPGLDGGHLLNYLIEFIIRRPISPAVEMFMLRIGLILLLALMFWATFNDIIRLFS